MIFNSRNSLSLLLPVLFVLLIIDRLVILFLFGFVYTGTDDVIMWSGAQDHAQGIFREPYFYGQNYSVMLESVLAVPLIWFNVPYSIALPLTTTLLAIFPFIIGAVLFARRGSTIAAAIMILVPLALPVEYGMLTSISRGFVTGVALASIGIICLFRRPGAITWALHGAIAGAAFLVNPNGIPLSIFITLWLLFSAPINVRWYLFAIVCALPFLALGYVANSFYDSGRLVHGMMELRYYPEAILESFKKLDVFFAYLSPFFWGAGWIALLILPVQALLFLNRSRRLGWALLITSIMLIAFLGINKVHDCGNTLFLPCSRMFLSLPVLLAIGLAYSPWIPTVPGKHIASMMLFFGVMLIGVKSGIYQVIIDKHTSNELHGRVAITPVKALELECEQLLDLAEEYRAGVIVFPYDENIPYPIHAIRAYGCPILQADLPPTFIPIGDRRTWIYESIRDTMVSSLFIRRVSIYVPDSLTEQGINVTHLEPGLVLVESNRYPLSTLLGSLGIGVRRSYDIH